MIYGSTLGAGYYAGYEDGIREALKIAEEISPGISFEVIKKKLKEFDDIKLYGGYFNERKQG